MSPTIEAAVTVDTPRRVMPVGRFRSRRRPLWIVAGVLSLVVGALGAVWLFGQVSSTQRVLQLTGPVARGDVIRAQDLSIVTIGTAPGVSVVSGDRAHELIGSTALIDLAPGALLPEGAVGAHPVPEGKMQVGLRLAPGRLPAAEIPPGTSVRLVPVAAPGGEIPPADSFRAETAGPAHVLDDGATLIDVLVASQDAEDIARWAATDQLALVREH